MNNNISIRLEKKDDKITLNVINEEGERTIELDENKLDSIDKTWVDNIIALSISLNLKHKNE